MVQVLFFQQLIKTTIKKIIGFIKNIIFNPKITKLLEYANSEINGLYMLVLQAFKAEEIWQDKVIDLDLKELFKIM